MNYFFFFFHFPIKADSPIIKVRDLLYKLRANQIDSTSFAEQVFSHDVQIEINTGTCNDGKFFGVREARVLVDRRLKQSPFFSPELAKKCEDQKVCDYRISHTTPEGSRTTTRMRFDQSKDKIVYLTINLALADVMGESYMKVLNGTLDEETFRKAFFDKNVELDVKNELGTKTLNYENLLEHLKAVKAQRNIEGTTNKFLFSSRRVCVDREEDCDFEIVYRLGDVTFIMWGHLTEAGDKLTGNVRIRPQKSLYQ